MKSDRLTTPVIGVLILIVILACVPAATAAATLPAVSAPANLSSHEMGVSVYVNSIDNIDMVKGKYTVDGYLHFVWTDPSIDAPHFEFMNGVPATANSVEKISEHKSGDVREQWYRFRADFRIIPNNMDYPYQSGVLPVKIEDADYDITRLAFVPLTEESGVEPGFAIPGWILGAPVFSVTQHTYPGNQTYSQLAYNIPITNDALAALLQTIVPPLIFCVIAGLSFVIRCNQGPLVALRYTLTTTMVMSAVMYHFSQLAMVPGLGVLKLFDKFMIAVYLFLAITIVATTFCYLAEMEWDRQDLVKPITGYGIAASILLPVVVFLLLFVLL